MDTQNFQTYEKLRPRISFLLNQGIEPSHIGQLVAVWGRVDAHTAYRWAVLSQEGHERRSKIFGAFGLFFLWVGAGILVYLAGQGLGIFASLTKPVQETLGSLGTVFLWIGMVLSLSFSKLARRF